MPHGTVSGYVNVPGGRLFFEIAGMGPPLVFIHGFSLDRRMWDDQWDFFRGSHTCIRYDVRAHGRSSAPTGPWADHDDLMLLLTHLNIESAHLCGLSMGGGIALDVAVTYPHAVLSLSLLDSAVGGYRDWSAEFQRSLAEMHEAANTAGVGVALDLWLESASFEAAREQPEVFTRISRIVRGYAGWHWLNRGEQVVPDPLPFDRLEEIKTPTLILVGERDTEDFRRLSSFLEDGIRGSHREVIAGAGHMTSMEAAREVNTRIHAFLAGLHASAGANYRA